MNDINGHLNVARLEGAVATAVTLIDQLKACDFICSILDMTEKGATKQDLARFEIDAFAYLGVRRLPDETEETFFCRIAQWPADGFIPAMRRNGIPLDEAAVTLINGLFNDAKGKK